MVARKRLCRVCNKECYGRVCRPCTKKKRNARIYAKIKKRHQKVWDS